MYAYTRCHLVLILLLCATPALAQVSTIFWTLPTKIQCGRTDGTHVMDVVDGTSLMGIDIDSTSIPPKIYYTERNRRLIMRANLDGSDTTIVVTDASNALDLELDLVHRKVYWMSDTWNDDRVQRADMDGVDSNVETIRTWTYTNYAFNGIAVDPGDHMVFWSESNSAGNSRIRRMNYDKTGLTIILDMFNAPMRNPWDVDVVGDSVYWTDAGQWDMIFRAPKNGSRVDTVLKSIHTHFFTIDSLNQKIYWTEDGRICSANLDGTDRKEVITGLPTGLMGIALYRGEVVVGVQECEEKPGEFVLMQNWPNPFNPATQINYTIGEGERGRGGDGGRNVLVQLIVYDILGREVRTLVNEPQRPGHYEVQFTGAGLSSGVYFYRLTAGSFVQEKRMVLVK